MLKIRTVPQQVRLLYLVVLQVQMLYLVMQDADLPMPLNRSCQRPQRKSHNAPLPENVKQSTTLNWMMDRAFHHSPYHLLSLGSDIPQPDEDVTAENAQLVPINPDKMNIADDPIPTSSASSAKTKTKPVEPSTLVPVYRRFVTVGYKLKCRIKRVRKFRCGKCDRSFGSQHDVNVHFKETHPPVKCDYCDRSFACPASMLKHRYSHL